MNRFIKLFLSGIYLLHIAVYPLQGAPSKYGSVPTINDVMVDGNSVTLDLSQMMPYDVLTLSSPWRLVLEVPGTVYKAKFNRKTVSSDLIKRIRGYQFKENPLIARVVLDLKVPVDYRSSATGNKIIISLTKNEILAKKVSEKTTVRPDSKEKIRKRDLLASLPNEIVTLDFEGADIRDVIRLMAETSNINIIFGPEVAGTISIHLKKVPFDEAFKTILNLKGLVASQLGSSILRVTTPDLLLKARAKAVVFTKTIPINYLNATEMRTHVVAVMAASGRKGTITVVNETNSLVITDSQEGIEQSERLILQLDLKPKQVMVEARIVEINLNNGLDIGVAWEFFNQNVSGNKVDFVGLNNSPRSLPDGVDFGPNPVSVGGTGVAFPGPAAAGITFGFIKSPKSAFTATIAALVTQSKAKILSSPKVVTINGKTATIEAVQDIPFRTSTVSGTGVVSNSFVNVSAGIILTVKPTINAEDTITLDISPESSFPTQESTEAGPIIRTRKAKTTVIIKDGETLVIGGLIDDQDTFGVNKVPLLGDIPIIGAFFRNQTKRKIRNELIVFVTPTIIRD